MSETKDVGSQAPANADLARENLPIRALIVDDETPGRVNLRYALAEFANWQVVGEANSAQQAREILAKQSCDVAFLDVQMPVETGIDLARELSRQNEPPLLIFVTAYNVYALQAFEVHALDYLLKPFDDTRLSQTLARAQLMLAQRQQANYAQALRGYLENQAQPKPAYLKQISVRSVGRIECILLSQVDWMAAAGNYVELHIGPRVILHRVPLSQLEQQLDPVFFLRVHRGTIVARTQARALMVIGDGSQVLRLDCGAEVAVSERYLPQVKKILETSA